MKAIICLIYDKVSAKYSAPLTFVNENTAIRHFNTLMKKNDNASDFEIVKVAEFSDDDGVVVPSQHLILAKGVVNIE